MKPEVELKFDAPKGDAFWFGWPKPVAPKPDVVLVVVPKPPPKPVVAGLAPNNDDVVLVLVGWLKEKPCDVFPKPKAGLAPKSPPFCACKHK